MTDFGSGLTTAPQVQSAITPKEAPVQQPVLLEGLTDIFRSVNQAKKNQQQEQNQLVVSDFMQQQLKVVQAIDQGAYTSQFGRTTLRKNLIDMVNAYPSLASDIIKANGQVLGDAGMGNIVSGTREEKAKWELDQTLFREGYAMPGMDEEQMDIARQNYAKSKFAELKYEESKRLIDLEKARYGVQSDALDLDSKMRSKTALTYLQETTPAQLDRLNTFVSKLAQDNTLSEADKEAQLEAFWVDYLNQTAVYRSEVETAEANAILKAMESRKELALKQIRGEIEFAQVDREIARNKQSVEAVIFGNENLALAYTLSKNFDVVNLGMQSVVVEEVAKLVAQNSGKTVDSRGNIVDAPSDTLPANVFYNTQEGRQALAAYFQQLNDMPTDSEAAQEQAIHLDNILKGVVTYQGVIKDRPEAGIELVRWMATPEFYQMLISTPGITTDLSTVSDIVQTDYADRVWRMVRDEFGRARVFDPEGYAEFQASKTIKPGTPAEFAEAAASQDNVLVLASEAITYTIENGTIRFFAINSENRYAKNKAADLNKTLAPVITNTVRALAHLQGTNQYDRVFEDVKASLFSPDSPNNLPLDQITLDDYKQIVSDIPDQAPALQKLIDKKEGAGDYSTLFGFSQKPGKPFSGIDVSQMTIGEAIAFASPRGEYGQWVAKNNKGQVSTPMGRYQIVGSTLEDVAKKMDIPMDTKFDKNTQDAIFIYLAKRRLKGKKSMAAKRKAMRQEWAGFKKVSDDELDQAIREFEAMQ